MDDQKLLKKRLKTLMNLPENQVCADCPERQPRWASLIVVPPGAPSGSQPIGAFVCLECSGSHRRLGVHIAFVRSINLDSWKEKEVLAMENGGNARVNAVFEPKLPSQNIKPHNHADGPTRERFIRDKYERRKYYDPMGFAVALLSQPLPQQKSSAPKVTNNVNDSDFTRAPPHRSGSVGAPSDVARQRLEERRHRIKHSHSALDRSPKRIDTAAKAIVAVSQPPTVDLLDFGSDFQSSETNDFFGQSSPDFSNQLNETNNVSTFHEESTSAPQPSTQSNGRGLDMFEFLTKDMKTDQPPRNNETQQANFGGDILSLYNTNATPAQTGFGNQMNGNMMNLMNTSMPALMSYSNGFDSFNNAQIKAPSQQMMMMQQQQHQQQRNQMMYQQQLQMSNRMIPSHNNMQGGMDNSTIMHGTGTSNNMMFMQGGGNSSSMMGMNNHGMMMQGGGGNSNSMMGMNNHNMMMQGLGNTIPQQSSFQMPAYGNSEYGNSYGAGFGGPMGSGHPSNVAMGRNNAPGQGGDTKRSKAQDKEDPFAQFGVNVFRS